MYVKFLASRMAHSKHSLITTYDVLGPQAI